MIDARSQYVIYKVQENERMLEIGRRLAAKERWEYAETSQPWYSAAQQWLKEKVFSRESAKRQRIAAESIR